MIPPTRRKQRFSITRRAWMTLAAVWTMGMGAVTMGRADVGAAEADALFEAHTKAFYEEKDGLAWFRESTDGGKVSYWMRAEQMEMVLDTFERTRNPRHLEMFTRLFHGFLADHGRNWAHNEFNDDIMWMVIACARGCLLSGSTEFRSVAKENFDLCYARAISPDLGGGLWWKTNNQSKNACVNGPGSIAAFLLGKATAEQGYFDKARQLFLWERATLFDPRTGRVSDNIHIGGRVSPMSFSYNQGTFAGAAHLLGYYQDAGLAAAFTMNVLCRNGGWLPGGNERGDGGGFNGIGVRWISKFVKDRNEQGAFAPWLRKNAEAAWTARRAADNLCWNRWPRPTPEGLRFSWGCSSAVVLLQMIPGLDSPVSLLEIGSP
ncbi:MAG: hypothetical protein JWM59_3575 [Verrucomicrobiales bacterium]|nr:hypothetical protein [Verrucomicrobiales bacterium]